MKIKRILVLLLVFTLVFSGCATAETDIHLRLWDIDPGNSFWRAHPTWKHELLWYDPFGDALEEVRKAQPDVLQLRLYNNDLNRFIDAELLSDLSASTTITAAVSRMMPWVRDAVTTPDGRLLALPISARVSPFYWYEDAWSAAGLTADDVPQSYTELLDFLDAWAAHPVKNVCASRLVRWNTGNEEYNYMYWLMELLLLSHEMQQKYAGEAVTFNTPAFIALAQRSRDTGLALYQAEPRQSQRQQSKMLQLFQSDIHGGEHANNGSPYGMSHTVPLRLTNDQPKLAYLNLEVAFINAESPLQEEGLLLLEHMLTQGQWWQRLALYNDFAAGDYPYEGRGYGHVDAGWLRDYAHYDGTFVCYAHSWNQVRDGETEKEKLMMQFFSGKISADTFAKKLDALLR